MGVGPEEVGEKEVGSVEEVERGVTGTVWVVALFVVRETVLFEVEGNLGFVLLRCLTRGGIVVLALVERE